jgi:hypothetical protein
MEVIIHTLSSYLLFLKSYSFKYCNFICGPISLTKMKTRTTIIKDKNKVSGGAGGSPPLLQLLRRQRSGG